MIPPVANANLFAYEENGRFYFSDTGEWVPGFKPATELSDALSRINTGERLACIEEYAVETPWHEMLHGMTGIQATQIPTRMFLLLKAY